MYLKRYLNIYYNKNEFLTRKGKLNNKIRSLEEQKASLIVTLSDNVSEDVTYEFIKSILENFSISREQKKELLHMIISEIAINELREIETIKLKIDYSLVDYLNKEEGVSMKDNLSSFILRNIGLNILNLDISI